MRFPPGSVIGIVGGGQLGRMLAIAAARIGYRCHVFADHPGSAAAQVAEEATVASYDDVEAICSFGRRVDVLTIEFENLPVAPLVEAARIRPVRPSPEVLAICQDRRDEKGFLKALKVDIAPFAAIADESELEAALDAIGAPAVLKTRRMGYDGKGQVKIDTKITDAARSLLARGPAVLEAWVDFACEISVVTSRGLDGAIASYVPVQNHHENHILSQTIAPARIGDTVATTAVASAEHIANGLGLVGTLAVEMFVTRDERIIVNELAPRPHNSGHWTIDACAADQFEQTIRAVAGMPLGDPSRFADAIMDNLLGDAALAWDQLLAEPGARLHLYGKTPIRPGRKHGHVTRLVFLPR